MGWVLGPGAAPQQARGLPPRRRERPPLPPLQQLAEPGVAKLRVRDRDLAAQARGSPALRVETTVYLCVDATHEDRRDRCDPVDRLPGFAPRFQGPHIRLGDLPVVLEREQQRDIDVYAVGQETLDRRPSLARPGHLDHHVRPVDRGPQSPGLSDRARGITREGRRHFKRDESIGALRRVIDRAKRIRGGAHVFSGQEFEDLSIGSGRRGDPRERSVVIGAAADRVLEDRRVGRHTAQPVVDHPLELAGLQHAASEVVEPDALPEVEQGLHARFHGSLAATAAAPSSATCGLTITCSGTRARYPDIRPLSRKARRNAPLRRYATIRGAMPPPTRSEEHTSELQSLAYLVCRLLLE